MARTAAPGQAAFVPHAAMSPAASNGGSLDKLNSRLNALLPSGEPVAYSDKHYGNDLVGAVEAAQAEYYKAAAPPPGVLERALYVVSQREGTGRFFGKRNVMYVLKKQRIFGFEICTGWLVQTPSNDGPAFGSYSVGPCNGDQFEPPRGLPTLPPSPHVSGPPG